MWQKCVSSDHKKSLNKFELYERIAQIPLLFDNNLKNNLQFDTEHIHKGPNFCYMIVSSDKIKFNAFGSDGKQYVRRPPNKQLNPKYTKNFAKQDDATIMGLGLFYCMRVRSASED